DRLIGMGGLQIAVTMGLIASLAFALGQPITTAVAIGMIFALSSTAIVLQTLSEKGLMQTAGGRSTFSVLLSQDIAVIPMLALLPLLALPPTIHVAPDGSLVRPSAQGADHGDHGHGHGALSLVEGLPGWGVTLVTLAAIGVVILAGIYLIGPLFRFIHHSKLREMYVAVALLIVIGIAFLMTLVGLSPALGTFLAGVVLANSEFRHELESNLEPFKGLLLGLFFITVGAGINLTRLSQDFVTILGVTLAVMALKGVVLYGLTQIFRLRGRDRWLFTLGLAQSGEFGFVLISFATATGVLAGYLASQLLLVVAMSMLLTPLFFIVYDIVSHRIGEVKEAPKPDTPEARGKIIIAGIGRFGQVVNRMVQMSGFDTTVLDSNLTTIRLMRRFGFKGFFGDPTRPEILHAAGLSDATVLVVALDDKGAATKLVEFARKHRPDIYIVARAHDRVHVYQLYRAGADKIVREMFDSSLRAGRYVLEGMGVPDFEASRLEQTFYKVDRAAMRELAELWVPGVPVEENVAYVERARQLNSDLETALVREEQEEEQE
ncbi:MAG: cation:proton antiporter, partial [Pseudomonadota bacterium]